MAQDSLPVLPGQTGGMTVRPLRGEDWRDCYDIWHAPRVLWASLQLPSQSEDEVREKVENPPSNMDRLSAVRTLYCALCESRA